jgi:hypothetical protein
MLDRLRVNENHSPPAPPRPAKVQPGITIHDFRKFTPKVLQKPFVGHIAPPYPNIQRVRPENVPSLGVKAQLPLIPPVVHVVQKPPSKQIPTRMIQQSPKLLIIPSQQAPIYHPQPTIVQRPPSTPIRKHPVIASMPSPIIRESGLGNPTDLKGYGAGRILVMIAAGPSVKEINFTQIKEHPKIDFMCINQPCDAVWPSKFWAFCDHTQYRRNQKVWDTYKGITINSANVQARRAKQFIIGNKSGKGFSLDVSKGYYIGRSSTYANMQVALYMGFKRIYVCGIDMTDVGGVMHYYGQNPDVANDRRKERFGIEAESYLWAGKNLPGEVRDRFVFCSSYNPWPFMNLFPKLDHKKMVEEILKYVDDMQK